ncbi:retrotransposon protein, putative, ty1-copia subclass [Tanacetum coccineum]
MVVSSALYVRNTAIPRDDIYEIDLSSSNTIDSSMYIVSNKRVKLDLDSTLLWHCRLGHIIKKRIEKLQYDRLLNSTDIKSFEKCVSCMSGKMARKPYSHQVERAKDLLGLIHTDVCGPFRTVSRQGASYFVTFTDDFSRYGYVYLLKHKHEVFETFKVFQKEVEKQLGKTIKSLRYDRGGEYTSQEFLDHLKEHGIIAHRTPTYTPQHNGVSERRNRTLLHMHKAKYFTTSSIDAEYIAAFDASKMVVWIQKFISGLGVVPTIEEPIRSKAKGNRVLNWISRSVIGERVRVISMGSLPCVRGSGGDFCLEAMEDDEGPLVDGVFEGAFGELSDKTWYFGEGVLVSSRVRSMNNCFGEIMLIFGRLKGLEVEALVDAMEVMGIDDK